LLWRELATNGGVVVVQNPGVSANILFTRIFNPALTRAIKNNLTLLIEQQTNPPAPDPPGPFGRRLTAETLVGNINAGAPHPCFAMVALV
jgi:hypothetical protein